MMLSHSEEWETSMEWMEAQGTEGREAIRSACKELMENGYLERIVSKDQGAKFQGVTWVWSDSPKDGFPSSGLPSSGKPSTKKNNLEEETTLTPEEPEKAKRVSRPKGSLEEITEFCLAKSLPAQDAEYLFHHWEQNGWRIGSQKIKDWQMVVSSWISAGHLPKQRNGHSNGSNGHSTSKPFRL